MMSNPPSWATDCLILSFPMSFSTQLKHTHTQGSYPKRCDHWELFISKPLIEISCVLTLILSLQLWSVSGTILQPGLKPCVHGCVYAQSCLTLCNPVDCSLPGCSVHGILQARVLERAAISFSRGSSRPRDQTWVSYNSRTDSSLPLSYQGSPLCSWTMGNVDFPFSSSAPSHLMPTS